MPAKEADPSKLTFKERLALQKKEEQAAAQKVTIANVMPGHIYIPKKTMLNVELIEPANSKTHKKKSAGGVQDYRKSDNQRSCSYSQRYCRHGLCI